MTDEQYLQAYDIVFSSIHSDGFKKSEIKDLLFNNNYWFLEKPNENWHSKLTEYLESIYFDFDTLNLNKKLLN